MLKGILAYLRGTVVAELVTAEPGAALTYSASRGIALRDPVLTAPLTLRLTMSPGQWRRLSELAEELLSWKRTTTYTVLKRLCDRGLFRNVRGTVTSLVSREEFYALQSERFVEETFDGSLPAFVAAFGSRKKLSDREIDELQKIIDQMRR